MSSARAAVHSGPVRQRGNWVGVVDGGGDIERADVVNDAVQEGGAPVLGLKLVCAPQVTPADNTVLPNEKPTMPVGPAPLLDTPTTVAVSVTLWPGVMLMTLELTVVVVPAGFTVTVRGVALALDLKLLSPLYVAVMVCGLPAVVPIN